MHRVVSALNSRIRSDGLSAREILYQRDQFTNEQIPLCDRDIISAKHDRAVANHRHSELSKSGGAAMLPESDAQVGDLVYLYTDRDKNSPRPRYLVTSVEGKWCNIRKFVGDSLRANSYKVKLCETYKVPCDSMLNMRPQLHVGDSDQEDQSGEESSLPSSARAGLPITPVPPDPAPTANPLPANPNPAPIPQLALPQMTPCESSSHPSTTTISPPRLPEPTQQRGPVRAHSPPESPGSLTTTSSMVPHSQP